MACRRLDACEKARVELLHRHPTATCACTVLDLEDFSSIRNFAKSIESDNKIIDVLVNNAGVMGVPPLETTSDNQEHLVCDRHFSINHFGTYLLTRLLLPYMAQNGRIVTVGSEAHRRGSLNLVSTDALDQTTSIKTDRVDKIK